MSQPAPPTGFTTAHNPVDTQLEAADVLKIATLAQLQLSQEEAARYASSLNQVLSLMDTLSSVDTEGVTPLRSPFDHAQPLREDRATAEIDRSRFQAMAPATQDGLYLVPRVIE